LTRWQPYPECKDSGVPWLGEIPEHWETRRLKYAAEVDSDTLSEDTDPNYILQYVDIGNVDSQGNILDIKELPFEKAPSRARRQVRDGDTIISTVRTYLTAIACIENPPENLIVSTGFAVLRPRPEIEPKYLWRLAQSQGFVDAVVANSEGIGYPAITSTKLAELPVWVPTLSEQRAIAAFLDHQTAKIDALIAEQRHLIEHLQERRAALISHAVTKGLEPDAPTKHSGIPAIDRIPAHWRVRKNKRIFEEVNERSTTGEEELLTVSHITGVTPRSEKNVYMFLAESFEGYKICRPNDLIINTMWAWMGALGITEYAGIVSPSYHVYRLKKNRTPDYFPKYLDFLYRIPSYVCEITRHSKGIWSSRLRLYPDYFFEMCTPSPPFEEQRAIAAYLDRETAKIDVLTAEIETGIAHLDEYRTALISAAVTGKIDVRDALPADVPAQRYSTEP